MVTWEVIVAAASAVIALAAFYLSWRSDARAKNLARVQMFLALRSRFLEVFTRLPPFDKTASDYTQEEQIAALAYWHHTFDEWYVTNNLSHKHLKKLWEEFYAPAVLSGMRHPGLRETLFAMISDEEEFGEYRKGFGKAMKELWESRGASSSVRYKDPT